MLQSQYYLNCIRTEKGYCRIQWKESSTTSPDPFDFIAPTTAAGGGGSAPTACSTFVLIPNLTPDGTTKIPIPPGIAAVQSTMCGTNFGIEGNAQSTALVSK